MASGAGKRKLFTDDADFNVEYEGEVTPGFSKFSKKKTIKKLQNQQLKKTYSKEIKEAKTDLHEKIQVKRLAANITVTVPSENFESLDFDDNAEDMNFEILSQQIEQEAAPAEECFIVFT